MRRFQTVLYVGRSWLSNRIILVRESDTDFDSKGSFLWKKYLSRGKLCNVVDVITRGDIELDGIINLAK